MDRQCEVAGCTSKHYGRGKCNNHWQQEYQKRGSNPEKLKALRKGYRQKAKAARVRAQREKPPGVPPKMAAATTTMAGMVWAAAFALSMQRQSSSQIAYRDACIAAEHYKREHHRRLREVDNG